MIDSSDSFPVRHSRIVRKARDGGHSIGDIRASGEGGIHEGTNGFAIRYVPHGSVFGASRR